MDLLLSWHHAKSELENNTSFSLASHRQREATERCVILEDQLGIQIQEQLQDSAGLVKKLTMVDSGLLSHLSFRVS